MVGLRNAQELAPKLDIIVNGSQLALDEKFAIQKVEISEEIGTLGMFEIEMVIWDLAKNKVSGIDNDVFDMGTRVELQLGYGNQLETVIVGEITGLEAEFAQNSVPTMVVRGHDLGHRLMRGSKTRSFMKMKDSAIIEQIARDAGLSVQAEDTKVKLDYVLQHNQTDLEFIQGRAKRLGYEIFFDKKVLKFRATKNEAGKIFTLKYPDDVVELSARLSTLGQAGKVEIRAWDMQDKKQIRDNVIVDNQRSGMGKIIGSMAVTREFGRVTQGIVTQPIRNKEEAKQIAVGQFNEMALSYITGEGTCRGRTDLRMGKTIEITNIGQRFSGLYYVTATTHTYSREGGYQTKFIVKRNANNL
ncbi:contractile injection system protein, VgrG/Pvc8 family [Microcoleus sp. POL10_C6]|uniref:contractile injection system protein, VgrG/Pvc8 family n=1 Tax=Microcoleus sp. POL10_C6 TaxID=2818852 RepID=UPI002FCEB344